MGFPTSRASLTASMNAGHSTSSFPTSSMTMMSQSRHADLIALTPTFSSASMSTPSFPTMMRLSISVLAKTSVSFVTRLRTEQPVFRLPSSIGSFIIPPMWSSLSPSISMTVFSTCVFPEPGRPVMPILIS